MKVVCDNCRAVYKVPDDKLTKAVNKATCRNCGHRMLIPRPKPNADPEERTLVTAVPPTPVGAPPRSNEPRAMDSRNEPELGEMEIARSSSSGPDDLRISTPMASQRGEQASPGPESDFDGPDTKIAVSPGEQKSVKDSQNRANRTPSMPPGPMPSSGTLPPGRSPPAKRPQTGPVPLPPGASQPGVSQGRRAPSLARETPSRETPGRETPLPREARDTPRPVPPRSSPPPRSGAYPAMALHDPASDLNWALLGTATALIGGFLLAFLSMLAHPLAVLMVTWFGLAMTFGGSLLSFMVLLTGARGRRPAKTFLSVLFGGIFAIGTSTVMVATQWSVVRLMDVSGISFSEVGLRNGTSVPNPPEPLSQLALNGTVSEPTLPIPTLPIPTLPVPTLPVPTLPVPALPPEPARPLPATPVRPVPPTPEPPPIRTVPVPAPAPVPVQPTPQPPIPIPVPPPPPTPQPTVGMQTVPMEVIYVMLSNNLDVKKCFVPVIKSGTIPPQIDLKFNIMPEGRATNAMVLQSDYRGSDLEACLVKTITSITFPPTTGSGTAITFPFVLQPR